LVIHWLPVVTSLSEEYRPSVAQSSYRLPGCSHLEPQRTDGHANRNQPITGHWQLQPRSSAKQIRALQIRLLAHPRWASSLVRALSCRYRTSPMPDRLVWLAAPNRKQEALPAEKAISITKAHVSCYSPITESFACLSKVALKATMIEEPLIANAPISGRKVTPTPANTPAATGMAVRL